MHVRRGHGQAFAASALLLSNAAIHVIAFPDHFKVAPYIGVLFLLLALAVVPLAVAIGAGNKTAWTLAALMSAVAIIAYVLARTTGLPYYRESDWLDPMGAVPLGLLSLVVEFLFLVMWINGRPRPSFSHHRYTA